MQPSNPNLVALLAILDLKKVEPFFNGTIKAYSASHPELDDYDQGYGFSVQHDWGKAPISEPSWMQGSSC